jgi:hypothetical protein
VFSVSSTIVQTKNNLTSGLLNKDSGISQANDDQTKKLINKNI